MSQNTELIPTKLTKYQILVIILLALTQFTVVLDFMVMSPLGDLLMKSMDLNPKQFSIVNASYAYSAGISGILTAGFADRFDRKKLLLFFYVGFISGTLFCGFANSYSLLVTARIITGIFGGVIGSISMAIVADLFLLQQRGRVMGFMQMGFGASQVLGIPISLFLANSLGWQSPFLMIVGLAILIWLIIVINMKPITRHLEIKNDRNPLHHLWHTVSQKDYRVGFMATALLSIGGYMMMPWGSAFAVNNLHVTPHQLPILFMISGVSTLIIMPFIGKLSDKIDKFSLFAVASIWLMMVVLIYTNLTPVPFWIVIIMNICMMIGIMSRMVPSMALVSSLPKMQDRGAFMSINSSLQQIAGGIASTVSGLIVIKKDKFSPLENYDTLGILITIILLIAIYMIYRVSKVVKRRAELQKL